jgi:hypothetical protein
MNTYTQNPLSAAIDGPSVELPKADIEALQAFAAWLLASGAPPCTFDLLVGPTTSELYHRVKDLERAERQHLADDVAIGLAPLE